MEKKKVFLFALIFIFSAFFCRAIYIYGDVYDIELNKVMAVITINTTPQQRIINYSYSFETPPGIYSIKAYFVKENITYYDEEIIKVEGNYSYRIDLILFPVEEEIVEDEKIKEILDLLKDIESVEKGKRSFFPFILVVLLIIALATGIFAFIFLKYKRKKKLEKIDITHVDEFKNRVENILKKEKRILQKDLRKMLNVSEAKLSLLITELEEEGKVKKIKRGRGNIIIWQERGPVV